MPRYKVVFSNGEKREVMFESCSIQVFKDKGIIQFEDRESGNVIGVIPMDRVLYVKEIEG